MFLRILKKDIKRKKTMNIILLIFVILAVTFMASSANNLITVSTALDHYLEKAGIPDYWFATMNSSDTARFEEFAEENGYEYHISRMIQIETKNVLIEGKKLDYSSTLVFSGLGGIKIFDKNNEEITHINDGEIYVPNFIFVSPENDFHEGGKIVVSQNGTRKEFTIKGYSKDVIFGTEMMGMTRFLISENDAAMFWDKYASICSAVGVYTDDAGYRDRFNELGINTVMSIERPMIKMIYIMDVLIAAILLVVSVCLILISMVVLRFIINFTITEEFREIGVLKAIGIHNNHIRGLYVVKYLAISVIGASVGLLISFPVSKIMIGAVSQKIVVSSKDNFWINIGAAVLAGMSVVLFSCLCTRRICRFSPIDAIHGGETGERYSRKGIVHLCKSRIPAALFLAVNDILSGMKNYVSMIIIFLLGTLLVIIPVNAINTLCSDELITTFNMAKSDHIISQELLFYPDENNVEKVERQFSQVREMFAQNRIEAEIFQEILFRSNVRKGDKITNSLSFQGMGEVRTDMYVYLEGTPPQNANEVALTYLTAEQIGAEIGDRVEIQVGEDAKEYIVTAMNQSLNNMGEGVRFHPDARLDYRYAAGSFGIQVNYKDNPDKEELARRKELLERLFPDGKIYTSGGYIGHMIGDIAGQLDRLKVFILIVVLGINTLVAVLMVKSFIIKEKNEIALLKAMGFQDHSLILWQTLRIGIVLLTSVIFGALISSPLSTLIITPIFQMMGAYSIKYEIKAFEVYVVFPMTVLAATSFASFLSAQGLRRIVSSEISNIE